MSKSFLLCHMNDKKKFCDGTDISFFFSSSRWVSWATITWHSPASWVHFLLCLQLSISLSLQISLNLSIHTHIYIYSMWFLTSNKCPCMLLQNLRAREDTWHQGGVSEKKLFTGVDMIGKRSIDRKRIITIS